MNELLEAIKAELQVYSALSYIGDDDIFIGEESSLPPGLVLPAIRIEDGTARNEQKLCNRYLQYTDVELTIMQRENLPGEAITGTNGVNTIAEDIKGCLINNRLGFTTGSGQVINVFPSQEGKSQKEDIAGVKAIKKTITFQYMRNMSW
jgi:hypothetical protein